MAHEIPSRDEMVHMLWQQAKADDTKAGDRAKLCRVIAHLMGYNRGEDYSDFEEKLRELEIMEAQRPKQPEVPWWEKTEGEAS
jgi:hypothetical protein